MKLHPDVVIIDLSRTQYDQVNWSCVESIKNGDVFAGKYKSASCLYKIPAVIIMANCPPTNLKVMSLDRWDIHQIVDRTKNNLVEDDIEVMEILAHMRSSRAAP